MPTIKIKQKTTASADKMYGKLKKYCNSKLVLKELGNLRPKVEWDDENRMGCFKEMGVTGRISISESSPCEISVTMEIPFLMLPLKKVLETSVQNHLGKVS
jgi:hypothetical protein